MGGRGIFLATRLGMNIVHENKFMSHIQNLVERRMTITLGAEVAPLVSVECTRTPV